MLALPSDPDHNCHVHPPSVHPCHCKRPKSYADKQDQKTTSACSVVLEILPAAPHSSAIGWGFLFFALDCVFGFS